MAFAVIFVAASATWFLALRPQSLGGTAGYVMIQGTSMEPTYHTGDLVIVRPAITYRRGDIVAYRISEEEVGSGLLVIHRITGGSAATGFVLRGDNNPDPDDWHPTGQDILGRAWIVIPMAGSLLALLHNPLTLASLVSAIVVAMLVYRNPQPTTAKKRADHRVRSSGAPDG